MKGRIESEDLLATGAGSMIEKDEEMVKVKVTRELRCIFDDGDLRIARSRCLPPAF